MKNSNPLMELSEYEAKRQRRIQENQHKLQVLGVPKILQQPRPVARTIREAQHPQPVRRSLRQRQLRHKDTPVESESEDLQALEPLPPRPKRVKSESPEPLDLPVTHPAALYNPGKGKKQHVSSSQIEIQLEQFHSQWLGTQLLPVGKQTVKEGLCPPGFVAKFSMMSGVQPWSNAVVLFVNVESESPYDNVFRQEEVGGRSAVHFQWFGQSRWYDESPLVMRLRRMKRGDESLRFDESFYNEVEGGKLEEPLLLFLRHTQGPYIYCGRLGYLGHRPASKPLEFRWKLLDVDSLQWEKCVIWQPLIHTNTLAVRSKDNSHFLFTQDE